MALQSEDLNTMTGDKMNSFLCNWCILCVSKIWKMIKLLETLLVAGGDHKLFMQLVWIKLNVSLEIDFLI